MNGRTKSVQDVADWRLCLGCGACAYVCPKQEIRLVDIVDEGIRPIVEANDCRSCTLCLDVCPAFENDHTAINTTPGLIEEVKPYCGPVLEIWEGHAADSEVRFAGSSGGLITALSLYCLEREHMHGVLHIGQDPANPLRNKTTMSRARAELMAKTGSRYAPASACDSLHLIEQAPAPCVFVGQPTEVSALRKARALRPALDKKVGVTISFFCAGSPATRGTLELLRSMEINPEDVEEFRYRGNGWPGMFAVTLKGKSSPSHFRTYQESWGFVQAYRPFSVHLCPDGTGEDADISCGDPWYREVKEGEPGSSILAVRTETGRRIVRGAIESGYVKLQAAEPWKLLKSQENLFEKRGAIWGRLATLRAFGLPAPKLMGFSLFKNWSRLSPIDKLRSTLGTARRIICRNYFKPLRLDSPRDPVPMSQSFQNGETKVNIDLPITPRSGNSEGASSSNSTDTYVDFRLTPAPLQPRCRERSKIPLHRMTRMTFSTKTLVDASLRKVGVMIDKVSWRSLRLLGREQESWNDQYLKGKWNSDKPSLNCLARVIALSKGGRLIEFGCGYGTLPYALPPGTFSSYAGFDISDVAITKANQTATERGLEGCAFFQMDMAAWLGDSNVSLILVQECLYYLKQREQEHFLLTCCRSLAADGRILVVVHDGKKHRRTLDTCRRVCSLVKEELISPRTYLTLARQVAGEPF